MTESKQSATMPGAEPPLPLVEIGRSTPPLPKGHAEQVERNNIHELSHKVLGDAHLTEAYRSSTLRLYTHRLSAAQELPGFDRLRDRARALKREVITHLDHYLDQFATNAERQGTRVHWATGAAEACSIVVAIARSAGAGDVVSLRNGGHLPERRTRYAD